LLIPNVLLSMLPGVSSLAHAGGFVAGALCALGFGRGWLDALNAPDAATVPAPVGADRGARAWTIAALAWTLAYGVAVAFAAHHFVTTPRAVAVRELMISALAADLPPDAARQNLSRVVDDPASDRALLERARESCARLLPGDALCARIEARLSR
jgi:hypothetical protein